MASADLFQIAGLLSSLPTFSGRPNPVAAMAPALFHMGQQARQEAERKRRQDEISGLLGKPASVSQHEAELFPGEEPIQGLYDVQQGSGLLGGEITPQQFYGGLLGIDGMENIGAKGLLASQGLIGGVADLPASVREYQFYQSLSPEEQRVFQTLQRGSQFQDLGDRIVQYGPDGSVVAEYPKQLKPGERPETQAKQEAAKTTAREVAKKQVSWPKISDMYRQLESKWSLVADKIDEAIREISPATTGALGVIGSKIPGTPPYNLAKTLDTIKANIGFDELRQMRDASPTGGALGQVSEMENKLLQAVQGSLDQGQSPEQLRENLQVIRRRLEDLRRAKREAFLRDMEKYGGDVRADAGIPQISASPAQPVDEPQIKVKRYNPETGRIE